MPARAMSKGRRPVSSRPASRTDPAVARTSPIMVRSVVVLPAPLRPSSTVVSPAGTSNVTPCKMWNRPMCAPKSRTSSMLDMLCPQIRGLNLTVGDDFPRRPLGQKLAVLQHRNAVRDVEHDVHLVLDQQDGQLGRAPDAFDDFHDAGHVLAGNPGGGLIQQQDLGLRAEGDAQVQLALIP